MMKSSSNSKTVNNNANEPMEWEKRPGGMLVQIRDDGGNNDDHHHHGDGAAAATGPVQFEVHVPAHSTFEPPSKEEKREDVKDSEEMRKALQAVAGVRAEVDKLSERVAALEVVVNSGTKIAVEEFDVSAELLMKQLLKLDSIEAEGEAKMQRKAEVRRVQKFHETLDNLKARNSKPFIDSSNTVTVTTQWETFDSGMGSLNPPPSIPSSTNINQDCEQLD